MRNDAAEAGLPISLTKPLGVGVLNNRHKATGEVSSEAVASMTALNQDASRAALAAGIRAATDVTGFGLLGHAVEMAQGSQVTLRLFASQIPVIEAAREYAAFGLIPAGAYKNRDYFGPHLHLSEEISKDLEDILYDPQTSGGLLISVARERAAVLLEALEASPVAFGLIGEVLPYQDHYVIVE